MLLAMEVSLPGCETLQPDLPGVLDGHTVWVDATLSSWNLGERKLKQDKNVAVSLSGLGHPGSKPNHPLHSQRKCLKGASFVLVM